MSVPDSEVVAALTADGHAVEDYFLIGDHFLAEIRGGLSWPAIKDPALAAAITAFLRRLGAREYASSPAYFRAMREQIGLTEAPFADEEVAAALSAAGVPAEVQSEFIAFQRKHGGKGDAFGLNKVVWGILHRAPDWLPAWAAQARLDRQSGRWHVKCADVHPSDTMTIDQAGGLYWCGYLRGRHYDDYFAGLPPLDWPTRDGDKKSSGRQAE